MAHLIKPCPMKDSFKTLNPVLPLFPLYIAGAGKNGKDMNLPGKVRNGTKRVKPGKRERGFYKPFTGAKHD